MMSYLSMSFIMLNVIQRKHFFFKIFFSNSEAYTLELLKNLEEMFLKINYPFQGMTSLWKQLLDLTYPVTAMFSGKI